MSAAADARVRWWFEQPVSSDELDELREVRDVIDADATAAEYGNDPYWCSRLCERPLDGLQLDASRCGGTTQRQHDARTSRSFGLELSGPRPPQLHVHAATNIPTPSRLAWRHDHLRIDAMFFDGSLGAVRLSDKSPADGVGLSASQSAEYRLS